MDDRNILYIFISSILLFIIIVIHFLSYIKIHVQKRTIEIMAVEINYLNIKIKEKDETIGRYEKLTTDSRKIIDELWFEVNTKKEHTNDAIKLLEEKCVRD